MPISAAVLVKESHVYEIEFTIITVTYFIHTQLEDKIRYILAGKVV